MRSQVALSLVALVAMLAVFPAFSEANYYGRE
jgi:hypothetical protein